MEKLWRLRAEIEVEPGDLDLEPGYTKGFMNVITWAASDQDVQKKLREYLSTFRWKLLGVEDSGALSESFTSDSEVNDMVERAKENPKAIILGTFHSYREG
jgi:hypothetical protein